MQTADRQTHKINNYCICKVFNKWRLEDNMFVDWLNTSCSIYKILKSSVFSNKNYVLDIGE